MKKVIWTIVFSVVIVALSLPIAILDGDATATVFFAILGICAIYSAIHEMRLERKIKTTKISCETCVYYDADRNDQPCLSCWEYVNWEKGDEQ